SHPRSLAKKILALQNAGASGVIVLQNSLSKQSRGKILLTYRQLQWLNYLAKSGNFLRSVLSLYLPGASKTGALDLNVLWKAHPQRLKSTPLALLSLKQDPWPLNDQHLLRKIRIPLVWGKQNLAKRLFSPLSKPHRSIKTWARFHIQIEVEKKFSQNVIGIRRGDHPQLRHQAIVIGAHYDHIGATRSIFQALGKDTVWNGADDNASGTAALLALAKAAMEKNRKFPRTLIFVAFGAEEYGLLGSQYYVRHPVFPLKHTVAMLNLDMVGRGTNKLLFVGGSSSSPPLKKLLKRANQKVQLRIVYTDWGIRRSDQWPFLTRHIPALFFTSGPHLDYHELSDEVDKINFLKLQKISQLALYTLHSLAKWPKPLPRAKPK
ncbi:MAG: M20/M25/M40 family metallo-hydrolase, partial [Planctomycetota bacterium]